MKAAKENRVVTVVQHNVGTKKDYGIVGFVKKKNASFLIFPQPISYASGTKVIGIKYDRIAEEKPAGPLHRPRKHATPCIPLKASARWHLEESPQSPKVPGTQKQKTAPKQKTLRTFKSEAELIASEKFTLEVQAENSTKARKQLQQMLDSATLDPSSATLSRKLGKVSTIK